MMTDFVYDRYTDAQKTYFDEIDRVANKEGGKMGEEIRDIVYLDTLPSLCLTLAYKGFARANSIHNNSVKEPNEQQKTY